MSMGLFIPLQIVSLVGCIYAISRMNLFLLTIFGFAIVITMIFQVLLKVTELKGDGHNDDV